MKVGELMQDCNLKGLWIPFEILTNEKLTDKEKYIYSIILFFSKNDGYFTLTNKFIANIINLSDCRVSKWISSLVNKNYIKIDSKYIDNIKQITIRKLIPLVIIDKPISTKEVVENDNIIGQLLPSAIVKTDKYKNNNKYIKNKYIGRNYSKEFLETLYANPLK